MPRLDDGYDDVETLRAQEWAGEASEESDDCPSCGGRDTVAVYPDTSARCFVEGCLYLYGGDRPMPGLHTADDYEPADAVEAYEDMRWAS